MSSFTDSINNNTSGNTENVEATKNTSVTAKNGESAAEVVTDTISSIERGMKNLMSEEVIFPVGLHSSEITTEQIEDLAVRLNSENQEEKIKSVRTIRKILSIKVDPPIKKVVDCVGIVAKLVNFLSTTNPTILQFESLWALTNVASGEMEVCQAVINAGVVPPAIQLLTSTHDEVREQSMWLLSNVAADTIAQRNNLLNTEALSIVLKNSENLNADSKVTTLERTCFFISNLCRGKPQPPYSLIKPCVPLVTRLIHVIDENVLIDVLWTLNYITSENDEGVKDIIDSNIIPKVIELLTHPSNSILTPALRTIGNIISGDDDQTAYVLQHNVVNVLCQLLDHHSKAIVKETCWIMSNIAAGTPDQIGLLVSSNVFPKLLTMLPSAAVDVQKEIIWTLSNGITGATLSIIIYLINQNVLEGLCGLFSFFDEKFVEMALESISLVLKAVGDEVAVNPESNLLAVAKSAIENCGGLEQINEFCNHERIGIMNYANEITETYFSNNVEDEIILSHTIVDNEIIATENSTLLPPNDPV